MTNRTKSNSLSCNFNDSNQPPNIPSEKITVIKFDLLMGSLVSSGLICEEFSQYKSVITTLFYDKNCIKNNEEVVILLPMNQVKTLLNKILNKTPGNLLAKKLSVLQILMATYLKYDENDIIYDDYDFVAIADLKHFFRLLNLPGFTVEFQFL